MTGSPDLSLDSCLSGDVWTNQQRIKQYEDLNHVQTWGRNTLNIDKDCADGKVDGYSLSATC